MSCLRYLLYVITISSLIYSWPVRAEFKCQPLKEYTLYLLNNGYGFLATGDIDGGASAMWFTDKHGNFVVLGVDDKLNACQILHGINLQFILSQDL